MYTNQTSAKRGAKRLLKHPKRIKRSSPKMSRISRKKTKKV
ncbi:MAG: hypothetical protein ACXVH2_09290 [Methanobacterium sp.]